MHACRRINKSLYIPALSWTWCSRACGCSGSDSILRSLFGSIQEMYNGISTSGFLPVISHRVIFVRWRGVAWRKGQGGRREGVQGCSVTILQLNMLEFQWDGAVNDNRCNSQSHIELRLCTWLAHDALHFFICLSCQRDSVPLQHLHSCGVIKAVGRFREKTVLSILTQNVWAFQLNHFTSSLDMKHGSISIMQPAYSHSWIHALICTTPIWKLKMCIWLCCWL